MRLHALFALVLASCSSNGTTTSLPDAPPPPDASPPDAPAPDACSADCAGTPCGTAVKDCAGVCNGTAISTGVVDQDLTKGKFGLMVVSGAWQTLAVGKTGDLSRIELQLQSLVSFTDPITIKLHSGVGVGGTVLRTGTFTFAQYAGVAGFNVDPLLPVTPATMLTMEITLTSSSMLGLYQADNFTGTASFPGYPGSAVWYRSYVNTCTKL
jgi:hypothetical protein